MPYIFTRCVLTFPILRMFYGICVRNWIWEHTHLAYMQSVRSILSIMAWLNNRSVLAAHIASVTNLGRCSLNIGKQQRTELEIEIHVILIKKID